jgi:hypothetical protein
MKTITIEDKYLFIAENGEELAYFEHFEEESEKISAIKICIEDKKGDKFLKQNNYLIQEAKVFWFSRKPLIYKIMFVKEKNGAFDYLVLITPKLLRIDKESAQDVRKT